MKDNMKKISTIFQIQWIDHSRGEVLHEVNPENQWYSMEKALQRVNGMEQHV